MAKKKEELAVVATVPTPLKTEDLMAPAGYLMVKESEYHQLLDVTQTLIQQKKELHEKNEEYKGDLHTMVKCVVDLGPLVGNGGFTAASIMKLINNREKLATEMQPMFEVIQKYTAPTV